MNVVVMRWAWLGALVGVAGACVGAGPASTVPEHTVLDTERPGAETDGDTDAAGTDAAGTDAVDTDAVDTDAAVDTDPPPPPLAPIATNRTWDVLSPPEGPEGARAVVRQAGELLGDWTLDVAGVELDGPALIALADKSPDEPFLRVVREELRRAIDLPDFLLFLDDVLAAGEQGRRGEPFWIPVGRLRSAGAIVHPSEVFWNKPRPWGGKDALAVDRPAPQAELEPAEDGDVLGPRWTARFRNPSDEGELLRLLLDASPEGADYAVRVAALMAQIRDQGGEVYLTSTVRSRERGYLMWGAFELSRASSQARVEGITKVLEDRNREWELDVPIVWAHPEGWEATVEAARAMADSYDVVYATEKGARYSNHYGAGAADIVAIGLPRSLTLHALDGTAKTFDLSDPEQTRDLSLTPELIRWVEQHFSVKKLKSDYPHWNDGK